MEYAVSGLIAGSGKSIRKIVFLRGEKWMTWIFVNPPCYAIVLLGTRTRKETGPEWVMIAATSGIARC